MIRINFTIGHLDRPDSFTTWGWDIPASAMSAGTAETLQAAQGQSPASAVANGETPNPDPENHPC